MHSTDKAQTWSALFCLLQIDPHPLPRTGFLKRQTSVPGPEGRDHLAQDNWKHEFPQFSLCWGTPERKNN